MNNKIFDYNGFNIIEDDNHYYIFRALEDGDILDINNQNISVNGNSISKIRTYKTRYNEQEKEKSKYTDSTEITLREIWDHIRKNFYPGTNCISFSTNANVVLDYANKDNMFAMIKVPKSGNDNIYFAGLYMLQELNKIIDNQIKSLENLELVNMLRKIDSEDSVDNILKLTMNYVRNKENKSDYLRGRFIPKQYFNNIQKLEYNKIIAKLTILESEGYLNKILQNTSSNTSLISTIGMAFSSSEVIHYNDNFNLEIKKVDRTIIEILAMIQQCQFLGFDREKVNKIITSVLNVSDYELNKKEKIFGNIDIASLNTLLSSDSLDMTEEEMYEFTNGAIPPLETERILKYAYNLALCKKKSYELCVLLKKIVNDSNLNSIIEEIAQKTYAINSSVISRKNREGIPICESVNLSLNGDKRIVSSIENTKLINYISNLSENEINNLINTSCKSIKLELLENILEKSNPISKNEYFARIIIDNINFKKIYRSEYIDRTLDAYEYEFLLKILQEADCVKLYNAFRKLNFNPEEISGYIINLLMNKNYQNYSFVELSQSPELDTIIEENIQMMESKINPVRLELLLGIEDNNERIENTNITLRDYQFEAVNNIDEIFETKKFAGVILPTGAGKSFVAMAEMLKHKDQNILYYAPNSEILRQLQKHILKYIFGKIIISDEDYETMEYNNQSLEKYIKQSHVPAYLSEVLPYFKMYCYQGLTHIDDEDEFFKTRNAGLIILDEVHRTGGEKWNEKLSLLLKNNPKAKILGITATPIRDVDQENMVLNLASASGSYNKQELTEKKYLAAEMYLTDAMQDNIVVIPNIVSFDYSLVDTEGYKEVKLLYESEKDEQKKELLRQKYEELREICDKSKKSEMKEIIRDAIIKNNKPTNGRYIIFIPRNNTNLSTEEYMKYQMEKVKEYFSLIDPNPEINYLISDRANKADNDAAIQNFEKHSNHLKLLLAVDMLNEGVHIDGVDGVVMLRKLSANNKILYLQQIGRCIYSLDPTKPELTDTEKPIIFDIYNNYLEQNMYRESNKRNVTSDLNRLKTIINWIEKHKRLPDINSENFREARKAISLKRIKIKYAKYLLDNKFSKNLTQTEIYEITEIVRLCTSLGLWDIDIPDRIVPPGEPEIENVNAFKLTATQKKFLDICKDAKKISGNTRSQNSERRLLRILEILDVLSEYGVDINIQSIGKDTNYKDIIQSCDLEIRRIIREIIEVDDDYPIGEEYHFARYRYIYKDKIFNNYQVLVLRKYGIYEPVGNKLAIDEKGFIIEGPAKHQNINIFTGTYYDENGYDINGYDRLHFSETTGYLNKYGFDREGFYHEKSVDGSYINTERKTDNYGFDVEGKYHYINEQGEEIIAGIVDKNGFDRDGYFYSYDEKTRAYVNTGCIHNTEYFTRDGYYVSEYEKVRYGIYSIEIESEQVEIELRNCEKLPKALIKTNLQYNKYGFDMQGYYWELQPDGKRRKNTSKINNRKFDKNGFFYEESEDGVFRKTNRKIDDNYFDIDGYGYDILADGTYKKRSGKIDADGFDYRGLKIKRYVDHYGDKKIYCAFDREGFAYKYVNRKYVKIEPPTKINGKGFDIDDNYHFVNKSDEPQIREYDKYGFDATGYNVKTKSQLDELGFDFYGRYYGSKSNLTQLGREYNPFGFDRDGYYWKKENEIISEDIRIKTNRKVNPQNLECHGFYCEPYIDEDGKRRLRKTNRPFDIHYFDIHGYYWELRNDGKRYRSKYKVNPQFFDYQGYFYEKGKNTGRKYDSRGYDIDGYFIKDIPQEEIKTNRRKYNNLGFDRDGYYWELNPDGTRTKTTSKLDKHNFDCDGYYYKTTAGRLEKTDRKLDENGFNQLGNYGYQNESKYDFYGYNQDGIHKETNKLYNEYGFDRDGYYWELQTNGDRQLTTRKYDSRGFDKDGYYTYEKNGKSYRRRHDLRGFDRNGISGISEFLRDIYTETSLNINYRNFDIDGYFYMDSEETVDLNYKLPENLPLYKKYSKKKIKTDRKYDDAGFDKDGYYWKKNQDGTREKTDSLYDEEGYDVNGFNESGIHKATKLPYNERYFDKDGVNIYTKTEYDILNSDINCLTQSGNYFNEARRLYDGFDMYTRDYTEATISIGRENYICKELADKVIQAIKDNKLDLLISSFAEYHSLTKKEIKEKINYALIYCITIDSSFKQQLSLIINDVKERIKINRSILKNLSEDALENENEIERIKKEINKSTTMMNDLSQSLRG